MHQLVCSPCFHWSAYNRTKLTALLNVTMLPAHERVHGVAPGCVLDSTTVPTIVRRVAHFWEDLRMTSLLVTITAIVVTTIKSIANLTL